MWYFIESSFITAWLSLVSTKHLRTHWPHRHILHTSNEWADSGASFDWEQMDSEKIVFFAACAGNAHAHVFFWLLPSILLSTTCQRDTCCWLSRFHDLQSPRVIAFCSGVECQIHSRVQRASFLEFVEGTRKVFATAKASLSASFSSTTWQWREGRQGTLNFFGRSQSISQFLNIKDYLSLFLKASEHQRNIFAFTYNCSFTAPSLKEHQSCTRPTHLPAQRMKQKGPGALSTVWRVWARFLKYSPPVLWCVSTWRPMTSKAANLRRDQFTFELCREYVIDACETQARGLFLCDWGSTREKDSETFRQKPRLQLSCFSGLDYD